MTRPPDGLIAQAQLPSPLGPLRAAATARGLALLWFDRAALDGVPDDPRQRWLAQAARELSAYWGDAPGHAGGAPDTAFGVPLDLQGTPFQRAVWQALGTIPPGATCSYADIAAQVGRPAAVRAVGTAIGANPVAIVVPCHRVIGRDGTLTGYAGGLARKAALLRHESRQTALVP